MSGVVLSLLQTLSRLSREVVHTQSRHSSAAGIIPSSKDSTLVEILSSLGDDMSTEGVKTGSRLGMDLVVT